MSLHLTRQERELLIDVLEGRHGDLRQQIHHSSVSKFTDELKETETVIKSLIEKLNAEVIAIATAGNQQDVEKSRGSLEITYSLIPTPNKKVVEEYGLIYDSWGAAYATFIIDKKGYLRFKRVETGSSRTSASRIIQELQLIQ